MLTIRSTPVALQALNEPQLCYALLTVTVSTPPAAQALNWAVVADTSRSMRIPIVDEAQFRALVQHGSAQETLVDGMPVWQLSRPVPPELRAVMRSPLDYVVQALHASIRRLGANDHVALVACAASAQVLAPSTPACQQAMLADRIEQLHSLDVGDQTDLAEGLRLALHELQYGRFRDRVDRLLVLTDGFTQRLAECCALVAAASAAGIVLSVIGLGGECQEDVLRALAEHSGGRATFLHRPDKINACLAEELDAARAAQARHARLQVAGAPGVTLHRVTRVRPGLVALDVGPPPAEVWLGDLTGAPLQVLIELLVAPGGETAPSLAQVTLHAEGAGAAYCMLDPIATHAPQRPREVLEAAARANVARLLHRACATSATGDTSEATRLFEAAAARFDALGELANAAVTRHIAQSANR